MIADIVNVRKPGSGRAGDLAVLEMAAVTTEKSADDLRREIEELRRQQREITERLRDPRGLRKGAPPGAGIRSTGTGPQRLLGRGGPQRGLVRRGDAIDAEDQPPTKKRLLSAIVKVEGDDEDGEPENPDFNGEVEEKDRERFEEQEEERKPHLQRGHGSRQRDFRGGDRDSNGQENDHIEPLPRVIPKIDDPNAAKRNRRMFGALLGTLEKFRQEDKKLSGSEAFMRRSTSQKRAEQRAHEESERLRQQEREQLAGKRKRDLILRARLAAKAEEKQLEVLLIQWTEHQSKLCSFLRTKAEPGIFYMPVKPSVETDRLLETRKEELAQWRNQRRAELSDYQRQCTEDHLAKVEVDIERWQDGHQHGSTNDAPSNTAEQMESVDGTGDVKRVHGKHGWHRSRVSKVSADAEDDSREDTLEDEAKAGTEAETMAGPVEVDMKDSAQELKIDSKDRDSAGALKEVMGYGSGEEETEER